MKSKLIYGAALLFCIVLCMCADATTTAAREALFLCGNTIIPSLFPFFVVSAFMVNTGFVEAAGRLVAPFAKKVFQISGSGAVVFVIGLLCGYPTGAKMVAELYEKKQIGKKEATRLLPFCNNSGPLFIIGAVGGGMLGDTGLGMKLYGIHAISAVCTGVVLSFFGKAESRKQEITVTGISLGTAFSNAVCRSVTTMLQVCGFIVFFSVIRALYVPFLGTDIVSLLIGGMAEVTLGAETICKQGLPIAQTVVLLSGIIGFGGICVLLQVWGVVSRVGLGIKTYLFGKLLQMGIATALATVFVQYRSVTPTFAPMVLTAEPQGFPYLFFIAFLYTIYAYGKLTNKGTKGIMKKKR